MVKFLDNNSGFNQWNAMNANKKQPKSMGFFGWLVTIFLAWWIVGLFVKPKNATVENTAPVVIEKSSVATNTINADHISADVQGLRISNISLKGYNKSSKDSTPVSLLDAENNFIEVGFVSADTQTPNINTKWNIDANNNMSWNSNAKVKFNRDISIADYVLRVSDTIKNNSNKEINVSPYARVVRGVSDKASAAIETGGVVYANSNLDYANWANLNKKSYAYSTVRGYFGFAEQYWETVVSLDANDQTISLKKSGDSYFADSNAAPVKIGAGQSATIDTYIFAGPRVGKILDKASENIPNLSKTMDYGWFWFFAQPMLWMINWLFAMVGNYGIAIILMTLILRLLMWPLTRKSYASTMKMQQMQPELQRIQKLYANDKARMQMEMMKVYQSHKTSPMAGCLPMLIQIPIFFALYKALLISVPMRSAKFLWISDLAAMDPYFILPILMGATMMLQQYLQSPKTNTNGNDAIASTQKAMKWMPILFTVMFAWMPAGLVLYWTMSNIFSIFQMYVIKKTSK